MQIDASQITYYRNSGLSPENSNCDVYMEYKPEVVQVHSKISTSFRFCWFLSICLLLASIRAFKRKKEQLTDAQLKDSVCVSMEDMVLALKSVRPSAMREVEIRVPRVGGSTPARMARLQQPIS